MIIGITGGIGSGKTRVAKFWASCFDLPLLDLDTLCRQLLQKGEPGWLALQERFGNRFFTPDGSLDRAALRSAIFSDSELRGEVDRLLHPPARQCMHDRCRQLAEPTILVEIPLLYEAGWEQDVDRIVVVTADTPVRVRRIMDRDGVSEQEGMQAVSAQASLKQKAQAADHVIENSGAWDETCRQIKRLGRLYSPA